jgi:hypothetical protein
MSDPISSGEEAFKALVGALALTGTRGTAAVDVAILTGQEDDQKVVPRVVCAVEPGGREVVLGTGNYEHRGFIEVVTNATDESRDIHKTRVQAVINALQVDDIEAQLYTAIADYHCFQVRWQSPAPQNDGVNLITRLPFEIVHCCTDLT